MPERKKVYLIDYPNFRTTRHWRDYLAANHDLVTDMYMNPIKAAWADVVFCEWAEGAAQQLSRRSGHFDDVYDHAGMIGPSGQVHSGDWEWPNAKLYIRGIDIDLHYQHFRSISWENVEAFMYIAPHFGEMIRDNMTYPESLKIEETNLSVKLDEWTWRDRPRGGHNIAWLNEMWSAKNFPAALYAMKELIREWPDAVLHAVSNNKSNEYWLHRHIKYMVRSLGLENNVVFYDSVPSVDGFLEDKDFLWQTSCKEGFSLIMAEALAKGIPALTLNWESASSIWPRKIVCNTPTELADRTIDWRGTSTECLEIASTHSHDKEIARLREITGL